MALPNRAIGWRRQRRQGSARSGRGFRKRRVSPQRITLGNGLTFTFAKVPVAARGGNHVSSRPICHRFGPRPDRPADHADRPMTPRLGARSLFSWRKPCPRRRHRSQAPRGSPRRGMGEPPVMPRLDLETTAPSLSRPPLRKTPASLHSAPDRPIRLPSTLLAAGWPVRPRIAGPSAPWSPWSSWAVWLWWQACRRLRASSNHPLACSPEWPGQRPNPSPSR